RGRSPRWIAGRTVPATRPPSAARWDALSRPPNLIPPRGVGASIGARAVSIEGDFRVRSIATGPLRRVTTTPVARAPSVACLTGGPQSRRPCALTGRGAMALRPGHLIVLARIARGQVGARAEGRT